MVTEQQPALPLWDTYDPGAHARTTDPDTSHDAAAQLNLTTAATQMHTLLRTYLTSDRTCEQAARAAGYQHERATKRVSDLLRLGLIEDTGTRVRGSSGRLQMVCRITGDGIVAAILPESF